MSVNAKTESRHHECQCEMGVLGMGREDGWWGREPSVASRRMTSVQVAGPVVDVIPA